MVFLPGFAGRNTTGQTQSILEVWVIARQNFSGGGKQGKPGAE
jgi:hypothetical protein